MRKLIPLLLSLYFVPAMLEAQPKIQLVPYADGFTHPLDVEHCGDNRLFIVEQTGKIWILDSLGNRLPQPFLDLSDRVNTGGNEQGLLGLAFHPDYAHNGYFYVNYITKVSNTGNTRIARFTRDSLDINLADLNSEFVVLEQPQPYANHNGGCLRFGPNDGYLYIGLGDGGSGGDPQANGQNTSTFLGKMLRINIDSLGVPYSIPPTNPFAGTPGYYPEIWDYGLRNPFRFSFDRLNGDLWIGDVGQSAREEVDYEPAGQGGHNYGWRCYEGNQPYITSGCPGISQFTFPIFDYVNPTIGCSVIGGFVYRGALYPELYGLYLFTDYCSGRWWTIRHNPNNTFTTTQIADLTNSEYTSLGQDKAGELYVSGRVSGKIYKIKELCSFFHITGQASPAVCDSSYSGTVFLTVTGGAAPITYQWSNGHTEENIVYLNPGTYVVTVTDASTCVRTDTFLIPSSSPPTPDISMVAGPLTPCPGDSVVLQSSLTSPGGGYQWLKDGLPIVNATARQYAVKQMGIYTVKTVSAQYCNSLPATGFQVNFNMNVPAIILGAPVFCPGDSVILSSFGSPGGAAIVWLKDGQVVPGETSSQLLTHLPGNYQIAYTGMCGQVVSGVFTLAQESLPQPDIMLSGDTLFASPGWTNCLWYYNGALLVNATTDHLVAPGSGHYDVFCYSPIGCVYKSSKDIELSSTTLPAAVLQFTLAPNPTEGTMLLTLVLKKPEHLKLYLTDASDRVIFMQTQDTQTFVKTLELQGLPAGTYLLTIQLERGAFTRKVIKK
jgi:glucose/arabinose dehydrogenase